MRPQILYPLFSPADSVKGVGARYAKMLNGFGISKVMDFIWHFPHDVINRDIKESIAAAVVGEICSLRVRVCKHIIPSSSKSPYRVICEDASGEIELIFFKVYKDSVSAKLPLDKEVIISGKIEEFNGRKQMTHPDFILPADKAKELPLREPIYGLTAGIPQKTMQKFVREALNVVPTMPEWLDDSLLKREGWKSFNESLLSVHNPQNMADIDNNSSARRRLAYDELLAGQLALCLSRQTKQSRAGISVNGDKHLRTKVFKALPFTLTNAQIRVLKEIGKDMAADKKMLRLLQGDVGSGKTIVAFFSLLNAVEAGLQGALMTPTDILARQHYKKLQPLAELAGINIALITGKDKPKEKQATYEKLANGDINIIIGTHALFQNQVQFRQLGLVIIDEQHRFGVHQRLALSDKGKNADVLVMTATPIPRTLALTCYGDMDISVLDEKPENRKPITTAIVCTSKMKEVLASVKNATDKGGKIYWVCPLVEESETSDLSAATDRYNRLSKLFPSKVGLIHGKMKQKEKDAVMNEFAKPDGHIKILVATTVIEVGIDVPDANIVIIEQAERFGLAQLHQLRGRVGRGKEESYCLLLYSPNISRTAYERICVIKNTEDGFKIAEEDLKMRGFGEVLGTKQSGLPDFKAAKFPEHTDLLSIAAKNARYILNQDNNLSSDKNKNLRTLLYLFDMDENIKNLNG